MLYPKESLYREVKNLDGFWHFCADKADVGMQHNWETGVFGEDVREAAVPASYNEQFNDLFTSTEKFGTARKCLSRCHTQEKR